VSDVIFKIPCRYVKGVAVVYCCWTFNEVDELELNALVIDFFNHAKVGGKRPRTLCIDLTTEASQE